MRGVVGDRLWVIAVGGDWDAISPGGAVGVDPHPDGAAEGGNVLLLVESEEGGVCGVEV